jgi:hypothetical protein
MSEKTMTFVGASTLAAALSSAGPDGLPIALWPRTDGKARFNGHIKVTSANGKAEKVVSVTAYDKDPQGKAYVDKNGKPFLNLVVGNTRGEVDKIGGAMFSNNKREGKRDPDFRVLVNITKERAVEGALWVSQPKSGGDKYLQGAFGSSKPESAAPAEAVPANAPAPAEADPFNV